MFEPARQSAAARGPLWPKPHARQERAPRNQGRPMRAPPTSPDISHNHCLIERFVCRKDAVLFGAQNGVAPRGAGLAGRFSGLRGGSESLIRVGLGMMPRL